MRSCCVSSQEAGDNGKSKRDATRHLRSLFSFRSAAASWNATISGLLFDFLCCSSSSNNLEEEASPCQGSIDGETATTNLHFNINGGGDDPYRIGQNSIVDNEEGEDRDDSYDYYIDYQRGEKQTHYRERTRIKNYRRGKQQQKKQHKQNQNYNRSYDEEKVDFLRIQERVGSSAPSPIRSKQAPFHPNQHYHKLEFLFQCAFVVFYFAGVTITTTTTTEDDAQPTTKHFCTPSIVYCNDNKSQRLAVAISCGVAIIKWLSKKHVASDYWSKSLCEKHKEGFGRRRICPKGGRRI